MKKKFAEKEDTQEDDINAVKKHLATINTYIKTAKKNFAIGKVDEDAYSSAIADLEAEKRSTEAELEKISVNHSNLASHIEDAIRIACNLSSYWNMGDFEEITLQILWRGIPQQPTNAIDQFLEAFTLKDGGRKNMVGGSALQVNSRSLPKWRR